MQEGRLRGSASRSTGVYTDCSTKPVILWEVCWRQENRGLCNSISTAEQAAHYLSCQGRCCHSEQIPLYPHPTFAMTIYLCGFLVFKRFSKRLLPGEMVDTGILNCSNSRTGEEPKQKNHKTYFGRNINK